MSLVTVPLYHYALLKGYLAGQNAPAEVLAAVEALHMAAVQGPLRADALDALQAVREAAEKLVSVATALPAVEVSIAKPEVAGAAHGAAEVDLPPLTKRALEKAGERIVSLEPPSQPQTDETKVAAFLEAGPAEKCPPAHAAGDDHEVVVGPTEPKQRKGWSPESRAAAADRMRSRQAAGLMGKRKDGSPAEAPAAPPMQLTVEVQKAPKAEPLPTQKPKPSPTIDPTRLITVHNDYAGKREDGQLRDEDWPDIKARLAKGDSRSAIASDYEKDVEDLEFFISSNQRREAKQPPGESRAPL